MKKFALILIFTIFIFFPSSAKADSVILQSGEVVNGKINTILEGLIIVEAKGGQKTIAREISSDKARDIITVGFRKKRSIAGYVYYADKQILYIKSASGDQKINRLWVRDIVLSFI